MADYWTAYACLALFESTLLERLLSWLPCYAEGKLLFICWLVLPRYHGAAALYTALIEVGKGVVGGQGGWAAGWVGGSLGRLVNESSE